MFVIRDMKIEAVRSLGICRKISASPYLRSAEIAVASVHPGCCLGNSWPSQSLVQGEVTPFPQPQARRCSKESRWDSQAELELSQRGDDEHRSRLSEHCVSWIVSYMHSCCMLCSVMQHCDICLGFCVCAKDYSCFPYAGEIKALNELIIWLSFLCVCGLWYNFSRFNSTLHCVWISKLT